MLRYAQIGKGPAEKLKSMSLELFNKLFDASMFTPKEITEYFRKEISEKYGEHKTRENPKGIKKSQLEIGRVYETEGEDKYIYFGKVNYTKSYPSKKYSNGNWEDVINSVTDIGYLHVYVRNNKIKFEEYIYPNSYLYTLKNPKKFKLACNGKVKVPKVFEETRNGYTLHIEFLDVKEEE
jgi:hypothetical protein